MKCPQCALVHPNQYSECVACGTGLEHETSTVPKLKVFGLDANKGAHETSSSMNGRTQSLQAVKPRVSGVGATIARLTGRKFDRESQIEETQKRANALEAEMRAESIIGPTIEPVVLDETEMRITNQDAEIAPKTEAQKTESQAHSPNQINGKGGAEARAPELPEAKSHDSHSLDLTAHDAKSQELKTQDSTSPYSELQDSTAPIVNFQGWLPKPHKESRAYAFEDAQAQFEAKRIEEEISFTKKRAAEEERFEQQKSDAQRPVEALEKKRVEDAKRLAAEKLETDARAEALEQQRQVEAKQLADQRLQGEQQLQAQRVEAKKIADQQALSQRQLEQHRQESERIQQTQLQAQVTQARTIQERMRQDAQKQAEMEQSRSRQLIEARRNLEAQLQPAGVIQSFVASYEPPDSHKEQRSPEPHKPRRGREPFGSRDSESSGQDSDQQPNARGYDSDELKGLQRAYWGGGRSGSQEPEEIEKDSDELEDDAVDMQEDSSSRPRGTKRRSQTNPGKRRGFPAVFGIIIAVILIAISGGATIFFMTKPPDDQRLYLQGMDELKRGQYAFAVKSLSDAAGLRPKDPKVYLALARAYVGVDQVDKAWQCVSQAQQLGYGVAEEPELASDLAKYYRQKGEFEKAINLLRPLAKAEADGKTSTHGKKAELADLDAMWGDAALQDGKLDLALRCWEEVRDLNDGSRAGEAQTRLATIYQRLANTLASDSDTKNDADALKYLSKLNNIAQNPKNLEMAAELYEKSGQLELAIDQLRKAEKMSRNPVLQRKLAALLSRRGKELMDEGNTDQGYAYLQQAKSTSPANALPAVALRDLSVAFDQSTYTPKISGRVWNPTEKSVNSLNLKVELFDTTNSRVLWTKDQKIIDEFVPPLGAQESKAFEFVAGSPSKSGASEFRVYLDGNLYKTYPIGKKDKEENNDAAEQRTVLIPPRPAERQAPPPLAPQRPIQQTSQSEAPPVPGLTPSQTPEPTTRSGSSAEERTMKDLDQ